MRRTPLRPLHRAGALPVAVLLVLGGCGEREGGAAGGTASAPGGGAARDTGAREIEEGFPVVVTDASGRELRFSAPPERIVSLVPSVTEILLVLGAAHRLVGRTDYDTASAVADLPSVGGGLQPALETLLILEPDLVIRFSGRSDLSTVERLDGAGVRHLAVRPDGIADVLWITRQLGEIVGETGRAGALTARIEAGLDSVRTRVRGLTRPRVAYVVGGTPPWVAGPGTFVHELIGMAGGENAFGDLGELYPVVSPEEFVAREIDLLLTPPGVTVDGPLRRIPRRTVPADLQRPGPTLHEGARVLARILHPEAFP